MTALFGFIELLDCPARCNMRVRPRLGILVLSHARGLCQPWLHALDPSMAGSSMLTGCHTFRLVTSRQLRIHCAVSPLWHQHHGLDVE